MTTFICEPDGEGEPCLWVPTPDHQPLRPLLRRIDLHPSHRHYWDELVERITSTKPVTECRVCGEPFSETTP